MTADLSSNAQNEAKLPQTMALCFATWILSFGIISPMVFEAEWGGLDWGKFGPNPSRGACNTYSCNSSGNLLIKEFTILLE